MPRRRLGLRRRRLRLERGGLDLQPDPGPGSRPGTVQPARRGRTCRRSQAPASRTPATARTSRASPRRTVASTGGVTGVAPEASLVAQGLRLQRLDRLGHHGRGDGPRPRAGTTCSTCRSARPSSTWPQYPTAVAADNLVDAGVVVVTSTGNSGANGLWSASAPASAQGDRERRGRQRDRDAAGVPLRREDVRLPAGDRCAGSAALRIEHARGGEPAERLHAAHERRRGTDRADPARRLHVPRQGGNGAARGRGRRGAVQQRRRPDQPDGRRPGADHDPGRRGDARSGATRSRRRRPAR